ncbi:MAG: ATP-binding protein [Ignisphaera sp.]
MPFFERPVERPEELFDREKEFEDLRRRVASHAITVVVGVRRVGKTSLVRASTFDLPRIYLDVRKFEESRYITYGMFLEELKKSLNSFVSLDKRIVDYLKTVRGVRIFEFGVEFSLDRSRPLLTSILESLDRWAGDRGKRLVIVVDEAQELIKMKGYDVLPAIAYAYDNLRNISFVFAGSKIGLLYRFLRVDDPSSPLYGRYMERIEVRPLDKERSIEFLRKGFEEHGIKVEESFLVEAVERLDGIIGWLSYLGLKAVGRGVHKAVIEEVVEEASKIVANEFCKFVEAMGSKRYVEIVKAIDREGATWSQIKRYLEIKLGTKIYDSELARLLKNLVDNGFIDKANDTYFIPDPILRHAARDIQC